MKTLRKMPLLRSAVQCVESQLRLLEVRNRQNRSQCLSLHSRQGPVSLPGTAEICYSMNFYENVQGRMTEDEKWPAQNDTLLIPYWKHAWEEEWGNSVRT